MFDDGVLCERGESLIIELHGSLWMTILEKNSFFVAETIIRQRKSNTWTYCKKKTWDEDEDEDEPWRIVNNLE